MTATPPPPPLITSALGLGVEAFVTVRAALAVGIADARAAFELTLDAPSPDWGFLVAAGIEPLVDALERLRMRVDDLEWLEATGAIDAVTRRRLVDARFTCDVDAVPEGTPVFPGEAIAVVEGPYWQAQLVAGLVRGALTEATYVATRFARLVLATGGADVIEHGAAIAHRLGGVPTLARAAYVGGARATTSALAGRRYGLPVVSLAPRVLDVAMGSEDRAIRAWLAACRGEVSLRLEPTRVAAVLPRLVAHARERILAREGRVSIELPSGDRLGLARAVVNAFAAGGLSPPDFIVSDASEALALELRDSRLPVRTYVAAADAAPGSMGLARYDLVSIEDGGSWAPRLRAGVDAASSSDPGRKLLVRYVDAAGHPVADVAHAMNERLLRAAGGRFVDRASGLPRKLAAATSGPLRAPVLRAGKRASPPEPPGVLRERSMQAVFALDEGHRRIVSPAHYPVGITPALATLKSELLTKLTDV
jgi:nicotinate phosphoribosyltransferase